MLLSVVLFACLCTYLHLRKDSTMKWTVLSWWLIARGTHAAVSGSAQQIAIDAGRSTLSKSIEVFRHCAYVVSQANVYIHVIHTMYIPNMCYTVQTSDAVCQDENLYVPIG